MFWTRPDQVQEIKFAFALLTVAILWEGSV